MEKRNFGNTGLRVSRLTFGCGAVGGLMTKGAAADQDRAIAWARDNGINFFDTAASYGNGTSEVNLGRALNGNTDGIVVSTKVGLSNDDLSDIAGSITRSLDASLTRLKLDHVDIFQLHNTLGHPNSQGTLNFEQVMDDVIPAFERLKEVGKVRFLGFTAKGDTDDLHKLVECGSFNSAQIFYNLLVPSAGETVPDNYPSDDFRKLIDVALDSGVGAIGVRVLAGGALSGNENRHPLGMPSVAPIGSETNYSTDVQRARQFIPLIEAGYAASLPELAIRYVISNPVLPTTEIGIATLEELQQAAAAVNKGPLSDDALAQIKKIQAAFVV
jgi:aryl-alcohol dehydrogenase-like predicted oxidoreductase